MGQGLPALRQLPLLQCGTAASWQNPPPGMGRQPVGRAAIEWMPIQLLIQQLIPPKTIELQSVEILHRLNPLSGPEPPLLQPHRLGTLQPGEQGIHIES